ncbi:MAG: DUF402 domain-containing protein, partial [Candidatus Bathyarchaeia archaeon]
MSRAKIRGIYSTALTKLLLDNGFTIVQPSIEIEERFNLPRCNEQSDIEIYDKIDAQGVKAIGSSDSVKAFCNLLKEFDDVVIRKYTFTLNGIYKGLIKSWEPRLKMAIVDIGVSEGLLGIKIEKPQEKEAIVQVKKFSENNKIPILSNKIKLSGKYLSIVLDKNFKSNNYDLDFEFFKIWENLKPRGLKIFLTPLALNQSLDSLKEEIKSLIKTWKFIVDKAEKEKAPATLMEGKWIIEVEFPWLSKKELDKIRKTVLPTVENHHYYKAYGKNLALEVDIAEKFLKEGKPYSEVEESLKKFVEESYPQEGSIISIEHVKLDGSILSLGKARVESFDKKELRIKLLRTIKSNGLYDGLDVLKEPGDIAISDVKIGEWYLKTMYYAKNGTLKGTYINFNTPIELYPNKIRYIDLEVDLIILPNGQ